MRSEQFGSSRTTKFLKPIRSRAWILRVAFLTLLWDGFSKTKSRLQPPSPLRKLYRLTALIELTPQPTIVWGLNSEGRIQSILRSLQRKVWQQTSVCGTDCDAGTNQTPGRPSHRRLRSRRRPQHPARTTRRQKQNPRAVDDALQKLSQRLGRGIE